MTKDEALNLALEALELEDMACRYEKDPTPEHIAKAIAAIKEALAQPEQEPVATLWQHGETGRTRITMPGDITDCDARWFKAADLYTSPPQRKPLTSQERDAKRWRFLMENSYDSGSVTQFHVWIHSWEPHSKTGEPTEWKQRVRGIALIDFIDRAIEAAHGIKE